MREDNRQDKPEQGSENELDHPLLNPPDTLEIGRKSSVEDVWRDYLLPELRETGRKPTTIWDLSRHTRMWSEWWASQCKAKLPISIIDVRHLTTFRKWLLEKRRMTASNANRHVASVKQILNCAARNSLITQVPTLRALPYHAKDERVYLENEQIDRLWEFATQLDWPRKDSVGNDLPYSPTTAWRSALVMWRLYGFRTQELIKQQRRYTSLQWKNIRPPGITPNGTGRCECNFGWLKYIPEKQKRLKPDWLVVPLNAYSQAALQMIRPDDPHEEDVVFDWPLSSTTFRAVWHLWLKLANVTPREESGVKRFTPKHLRKTTITMIDDYRDGMSEHIVGHAADRSGQSKINSRHYRNPERGVLDTMLSMPVPSCFESLITKPT